MEAISLERHNVYRTSASKVRLRQGMFLGFQSETSIFYYITLLVKPISSCTSISTNPFLLSFVEYAIIREAESAIQHFNGKNLGRGISLVVKLAESKKDREERLKKKREDDAFLNTLSCARGSIDEPEIKEVEEEAEKMVSNPLNPRYLSSPEKPAASLPSQQDLGSSGGAASLRASSVGVERKRSGSNSSVTTRPCVVCETPTGSSCSGCKTAYCSTQCQSKDWPSHRSVCKSKSSQAKSKQSSSPQARVSSAQSPGGTMVNGTGQKSLNSEDPLKIADDSGDEGFVISCHDADSLLPVKSMIEHVAQGNDPALLQVLDFDTSPKANTEPRKSVNRSISFKSEASISDTHSSGASSRLNTTLPLNSTGSHSALHKATKSLPATPLGGTQSSTARPPPNLGPFAAHSTLSRTPSMPHVRHMPFEHSSPLLPLSRLSFPAASTPNSQNYLPLGGTVKSMAVPISSIYCQYDMMPQPLPSLALTSPPPLQFVAIVTCYHSPTKFTVVIPSVESKMVLKQITECADTFTPGAVMATYLTQGSKCGHMDTDGNFSRVSVVMVDSPDNVIVQRYDFGGCFSAKAVELSYLPESVVLLPSLALDCVIPDILVSEKGLTNIDDGCQALRDLIKDQPVLVESRNMGAFGKGKNLFCMLKSGDGSVDIVEALCSTPYVTVPQQSTAAPASNVKLMYLASRVQYHAIVQNNRIEIEPTVVINPHIIWAQVVHPLSFYMDRMHRDMNNCYPPRGPNVRPYVPNIGEMCVAKYLPDQQYYRAEVLCVNQNGMVDVRYVESGRTDTISTSQLYHIEPGFLSLPKQARKFVMGGVAPAQSSQWSENAVVFLREKILNRKVSVCVLSVSNEECVVDVFDPELQNQALNNSLILFGHAQPSKAANSGQEQTPSQAQIAGVKVTKKFPQVKGKQEQRFPRENGQRELNEARPAPPDAATKVKPFGDGGRPRKEKSGTPSTATSDSQKPFGGGGWPRKEKSATTSTSFTEESKSALTDTSVQSQQNKSINIPVRHKSPASDMPGQSEVTPLDTNVSPLEKANPGEISLKEGDCVQVHVTCVFSPNRFFVQVVEPSHVELVKPMMSKLEQLNPASLTPLKKKSAGKDCLCLYEDGALHRAAILQWKQQEVKVKFVDYGNTCVAKGCDIYETKPELLTIPPQALLCSINQAFNPNGKKDNWDSAVSEYLKSVLEGKPGVMVKVVQIVNQHLHVVDVMVSSPEGKVDVLDLLVEKGHVKPRKERSQGDSRARADRIKQADSKPFSAQNADGFKQKKHGSSPFGQKAKRHDSKSPESKPSIQKPKESFPAHSLSTSEESTVSSVTPFSALSPVNSSAVSPGPVYPLVSTMKKMTLPKPPTTFKLIVSELASLQEIYVQLYTTETSQALQQLPQLLQNLTPLVSPPTVGSLCCAKYCGEWYRCEVLTDTQGSYSVLYLDYGNNAVVTLADMAACPSECVSVPVVAIKCGVSCPSGQQDQVLETLRKATADCVLMAQVRGEVSSIPQVKLMDESGKDLLEGLISYPLAADLKIAKLPASSEGFSVLVCEVTLSGVFYIQVAAQESLGVLQEIASSVPEPLPFSPTPGALCFAKYSQDKNWYRVDVLDVSNDSCEVFYLDYGNTDKVALSDMAVCPDKFTTVPPAAVKCVLDGMPPNSFTEDVKKFLIKHTADRIVSARIVQSRTDGVPQVELVADGVNLLQRMKEVGFVKSATRVHLELLPRVADMNPGTLPSPHTDFQALVTEVTSPHEIYLQVATQEIVNLICEITGGLNAVLDSSPPPPLSSPPPVGSLCCTKFSEDSQWYRVEVLGVRANKFHILFIDYGNKDTVPLSSLVACPAQYASCTVYAVKCALHGVPTSISCAKDVMAFLVKHTANRVVSARVVQQAEGAVPEVELLDEGVSLLQSMKDLGIVKLPSTQILPMVSDMKATPLPQTEFRVMVTEVASPMEMYVQLATQEIAALVCEICNGLSAQFATSPPPPLASPPPVGSLCCTKFSEDSQWYRVEVLGVRANKFHILFIDYGNKDTVPQSSLVACPAQYAATQVLAIKCALSGMSSDLVSSKDVQSFIIKHATNRIVSARVIATSADGVPEVELLEDGVSMLEHMKEQGIIKKKSVAMSPVSNSQVKSKPLLPRVCDMKPTTLPSSFQAMVTEVAGPCVIYLQVATQENADLLSKLSEGLNAFLTTNPPPPLSSPPPVGSLCCTKFSEDSQWYRVEVMGVRVNKFHILFIDYGNKDTVPLSSLVACPAQYAATQILTVKCALSGISSDLVSNKDIQSFIIKHAANRIVSVKVIATSADGVPEVELLEDGVSMLEHMKEQGIVKKVASPVGNSLLPRVCDMKPTTLPSSFQAMVTEIAGPCEIYLQVATQENADLLSKLSEGLNAFLTTNPPPPLSSPPPVGSLCCTKFSEDSQWYRVEVLWVRANKFHILFIDYGNKDTVPQSSLVACPAQYAATQVLTVKCALSGMSSDLVSSKDVQSFIIKHAANRIVSVKVIATSADGVPEVELLEDGVSMLEHMKEQGIIKKKSVGMSPVSNSQVKSKPLLPRVCDMKPTTLPSSFQAMVTEVAGLCEIYLQVATQENADLLSKLSEGLNAFLTTNPPPPLSSPPPVGSLCCTKFSEDSQWYRVEVLGVRANKFHILFIDYGNKDIVPLSSLVACPAQYAATQVLTVNCALSGMSSDLVSSKDVQSFIIKHAANRIVSARVIATSADGVPEVELLEDGVSMLEHMKEQGIVKKVASPVGNSLLPRVCDMKPTTLPSSFQAMVTEIVGPCKIYLQVATQENADLLSKLSEGLNAFFTTNPPPPLSSPPPVGSLCCTKFSEDSQWYRVEVLGVENGGKFSVLFIDYGNKDVVHVSSFAACPSQYASVQIFSVKCSLSGVASEPSLDANIKSFITKHAANRILPGKVVAIPADGIPAVELFIDGVSMSECMMKQGVIKKPTVRSTLVDTDRVLVGGSTYQSKVTDAEVVLRRCQVTDMTDPSSFHIQFAEKQDRSHLAVLNQLQKLYSDPTSFKNFIPTVGGLCCAQYSAPGDTSWYRCKILSHSKQVASLLYIDFGSVCKVLRSKIYQLDEKFASLPPLAVHCKLSGVRPASGQWSEKAIEEFGGICDGKFLYAACVAESAESMTVVELYTDPDHSNSVAQALVSGGYGVVVNK